MERFHILFDTFRNMLLFLCEYYIGFFILPNIFPLQPGPLRQTFTHNPLQQSTPSIAAATKSAKAKQAPPATAAKKRPWEETIG